MVRTDPRESAPTAYTAPPLPHRPAANTFAGVYYAGGAVHGHDASQGDKASASRLESVTVARRVCWKPQRPCTAAWVELATRARAASLSNESWMQSVCAVVSGVMLCRWPRGCVVVWCVPLPPLADIGKGRAAPHFERRWLSLSTRVRASRTTTAHRERLRRPIRPPDSSADHKGRWRALLAARFTGRLPLVHRCGIFHIGAHVRCVVDSRRSACILTGACAACET